MRKVSALNMFFLFVGIAVALTPSYAAAAIKSPSCQALAALGREIVPNQNVPINRTPSRFSLPGPFATPRTEEIYGAPALAWSQGDVAAAIKGAGDCATAAKKARNAADAQALATLWRSLGGLRGTLGAIAATEPKIDTLLKTLLEDERSRLTLDALIIVASVRDGGPESFQKTPALIRESSLRHMSSGSVHSHAQNLLKALSDAPEGSWQRVFPPLDARIAEMRAWAVDDAVAGFAALPDSIQGIGQIERVLQKAQKELAFALDEAQLARVDEAAKARREAIEEALLTGETARVDGAPTTAAGLDQLRQIQQGQVRSVLTPARVAALDGKIAARREVIGNAVADEQIKRLDQFPDTLAGLADLDGFATNTQRGLLALAGPAPAARFQEAATKRAGAIGEAAFKPFRKALDDMPATEEGLGELDRALGEVKGPIDKLAAPLRARYDEAVGKRRKEIVAAVEKENAKLARLPLAGGVYVDPETGAKLEFRNRSRAYLTMFNETKEGEYEVDGDRVIFRLPTTNIVFTRQGAWIRGGGASLKRQSDK